MSVEDRLRSGLAENALALTPDVERNLEQVHARRRHQRWVSRGAAAIVSAAVITTALVLLSPDEDHRGQPTTPGPQSTESAEPSPPVSLLEPGRGVAVGAPFPDGVYRRVLTRADARRLGVDASVADEVLGSDGTLALRLSVMGENWALHQTNDAGRSVLGDYGSIGHDAQGRIVTVSRAPGCMGCRGAFTVRLQGEELILAFAPGEQPSADARLVMEGTWRRQAR